MMRIGVARWTLLAVLLALAAGWTLWRLRDERTASCAGGRVSARGSAGTRTLLFVGAHRLGEHSGIFSIRSDGLGRRKLLVEGLDAALSPDGRRMVFAHYDNRRPGLSLRLANVDSSNGRDLTPAWLDASSPSWSPDGRQVAFTGMRWGRWHGGSREFLGMDVWLVDVESGRLRRLRPGMRPSWSPDGRAILYAVPDPT